MAVLPHKAAAAITVLGALIGALSKPVTAGDKTLVSKEGVAKLAPATRASLGVKVQH